MTQGEQLIGIAIGWQPSRLNDSGKTVPGKLELAIDGESNAELAFFQNHMQFLSGKDGSSFLDKQVSIHAIYKSFYEPTNMRQFTPAGTLRVIGDQQAVAPTQPVRQAPQAPPPASRGTSKDPQRDSIERQVAAKDATAIVISTGFLRDAPPALTLDLWNYWYRHILNTIQGTPTDFDINPEGKREEYRRAVADPEVDLFGDQIQPLATFNDEEEE